MPRLIFPSFWDNIEGGDKMKKDKGKKQVVPKLKEEKDKFFCLQILKYKGFKNIKIFWCKIIKIFWFKTLKYFGLKTLKYFG